VGEEGRRDTKALPTVDATDARGPPEANGSVTRGPQSIVCLRPSVLAKPWSRGGNIGATPSTTAGVLASTPSIDCYFYGELLSNPTIFVSRSELE
jgi:hypothetical protein